jgi:hypothetical protein
MNLNVSDERLWKAYEKDFSDIMALHTKNYCIKVFNRYKGKIC